MRTKKISFLMENGLPSKFLINLSDKQVDNLYTKYLGEEVKATTFYNDPDVLANVSRGLGEAMVGINVSDLPAPHRLAERGW
jgi:hypothetical protein